MGQWDTWDNDSGIGSMLPLLSTSLDQTEALHSFPNVPQGQNFKGQGGFIINQLGGNGIMSMWSAGDAKAKGGWTSELRAFALSPFCSDASTTGNW